MNQSNISNQTNANNSNFAVGEKVVFIGAEKTNQVMTVFKVQGDGVLLDGNRNFALNHLLRHATPAEVQANTRQLISIEEFLQSLDGVLP